MSIKDELKKLVGNNNNSEAYTLFKENLKREIQIIKDSPEYCALAASICINSDHYDTAFDLISIGLTTDNHNYELFLLLGEYYFRQNIDKALLCFYQAMYYCGVEEDRAIIQDFISDAINEGASINPVSFVVVADNDRGNLEKCINSIYNTVPQGLFEVVLVTNEGCLLSEEYLASCDDLSVYIKDGEKGFIRSCNYGIKQCDPNNDVFVLRANYELIDNSFFYLLLGLYDDDRVGALTPLSNKKISGPYLEFANENDWLRQVSTVNVPVINAYEKKTYCPDLIALIRRKAIDTIGLFDESFSPEGMEGIDYGMRMQLAKFEVRICYNSFIHYVKTDTLEVPFEDPSMEKNKKYLKEKWHFDAIYSNAVRTELINLIEEDENSAIEVLELGCAMGSNLNNIKFKWPNSKVYGVEYDEEVVRVGKNSADIIHGDVENMVIPYREKQFDYIICADVLEHLRNPEATLKRFAPYLKDDGKFIVSLPNIRYFAISMMLLLHGRFDYADSGILDRTHVKFFTRDTAIELLKNSGLEVIREEKNIQHAKEADEFIENLTKAFEVTDIDEIKVFQYYFLAKKRDIS